MAFRYYLKAYFNPDQAFEGTTQSELFNECIDLEQYVHFSEREETHEELARICLTQYLQELKTETYGYVWIALFNCETYLGQFLFNTDVYIPEPIPEVWTEFVQEIK